jgi:GT2 family glycosyltransferase/glycosyltransferase involved in cell wall biosynthesis
MENVDPFEEFRRRVLAGVQAYDFKLASDVETYRSQRAWRVMLACRKAYSLAVRGGWRGRWRMLRWALRGMFGGPLGLETEDLQFPDLASYLPEELFYPVSEMGGKGRSPVRGRSEELRYDVLVFPVFEYDSRFQRPQQIAVEFARRGHRVFWISPSRVVSGSSARNYEIAPLRESLWELRLRMPPQDLYGGTLSDGDLAGMMASLTSFFHGSAVAACCSLVQFPYWRKCALALRGRFGAKVVYDCMDDWRNWSAEPAIGPFSLAEERSLAHDCDLLMVTAGEFEERYRREGLSPVVVRNAADFGFFAAGTPRALPVRIPRPVIGYYGAIADWFDLEVVGEVARARPQYSFVLIGRDYRDDMDQLRKLPNVFLLGEKHYRDLPSYLRDFSVCLIPFVPSAVVKAVNPVKLYEYFSQGKPVVSTPMPELEPLGDLVYFADGPQEFAAQIDAALAESDPSLAERRVSFAARNTWAHRVDDITAEIQAKYPLVSILMVTYNCREFLRPCLDSIFRNTAYPNYEVVVVDNNSSDGGQDILREYAARDSRIRLELLAENRGFGGGNNEAARHANGEYLLLLNPDTIVTFGWMHRLLRVFQAHPDAGIAAPVTNFSGNETKIDFEYADVTTMEEFAHSIAARQAGTSSEIAVAPLLCGLIPRRLWFSLGGLDEGFRVGMFEDDDFSLRVRQAGFKIMVAEDCFIHHFGNGSFAKLPSEESRRIFEENRRIFEEKSKRPWIPHRRRAGVKSNEEEPRFTPEEFLASRRSPTA